MTPAKKIASKHHLETPPRNQEAESYTFSTSGIAKTGTDDFLSPLTRADTLKTSSSKKQGTNRPVKLQKQSSMTGEKNTRKS